MPRKGENIYKRKDGRWEGRYIKARTTTGKIKYGYVYGKTYREAKKKLREKYHIYKDIMNQSFSFDGDPLFSHIAMNWLESVKPNVKESTYNKYHNILTWYILPEYDKKKISQITYSFIETHITGLLVLGGKQKTGLSAKTVSDVLAVIRNILAFAAKNGMYVPCDGKAIRVKKQSDKTLRVLSLSEQENLCRYLLSEPTAYNIGILVCLFTGLRLGEMCALRWEDVSFSDQTIHVRRTIQRIQDKSSPEGKTKIVETTPKSSCSIRTIPIPDELCQILSAYQTSQTGYLLTNHNTIFVDPRTLQYRFQQALEASGVEHANYHALRHTFATRCIELGFDVKSLSEILGHSTVNITMNRYVHPTLALKKENMKRLAPFLAVN